jgi:hypothetical protein
LHSVVLPDDVSNEVEQISRLGDPHYFDSAYIAKDLKLPILSDDLLYRQLAKSALGCNGLWLQAVLMAALGERHIRMTEYSKAVVALAARHHSHVALGAEVLFDICVQDDGDLHRMRAALRFLANPQAEMWSHLRVVLGFIRMLWSVFSEYPHMPTLKREAATGLVLEAFLRHRSRGAAQWLKTLVAGFPANHALARYVLSWIQGHFLVEVLQSA